MPVDTPSCRGWVRLAIACTVFWSCLGMPSADDSDGQATTVNPDTYSLPQDSDINSHDIENILDFSRFSPALVNKGSTELPRQELIDNGNSTLIRLICPSIQPSPIVLDPTPSYNMTDSNSSLSDKIDTNNITTSTTTPNTKFHADSLTNPESMSTSVAKVNFSVLEFGENVEVNLESKGCLHVTVGRSIPDWIERLSFSSSEGRVTLQKGWAERTSNLKKLWLRIPKGLIVKEVLENGDVIEDIDETSKVEDESTTVKLCQVLPPSLELLDVSHTPMKILQLDEHCSLRLLHLEASHSALKNVALCSPSLITLHLSSNSIEGNLDWVTCKDGLAAVENLQVNQNSLSEVSTCGWAGIKTLDLRRNSIITLDLSTCPSSNLTSVTASHNDLITPPILPPALLHLDLNHNLLESLPMITSTLMTADFSHNNIIEVGKSRFKRARKLRHLSLAYNRLTHLKEHDLTGLRELRILDVSHNRLREIAGASLMSLRRLEALHLHHNHLTKLDARDLASLTPRAYATLHHNPWLCSCQLLSSLQRLQSCPECKHQNVPVECKERGTWLEATAVLHSCLQAVQEVTQRLNDESDEDISEEDDRDEKHETAEPGVVMAVPGLLVLILIGAVVAMGYRWYGRHKRNVSSRLFPCCRKCRFCNICGCSPVTMNNNVLNHHGQLSHNDQDSDTETEL